ARSTYSVNVHPRASTYRRNSESWFSGSWSSVETRASTAAFMRPSWVVGFPFTLASSPLTGFATVDGLGALAGDRPLALRFHDAFGFRPRQQCPTHLLRERNAVADLDRLQGSQQVLVQTERGLFQRGHVVLCITS